MNLEESAPKRTDIRRLLDSHDEVTFDVIKNAYPALNDESINKILSDLSSYGG